jgi:AcrR family transcriptional regulator
MAAKSSGGPHSAASSADNDAGELDVRVRRSRDRVLEAAFELLSQSGVSGFTVDVVASQSGVAKTTIYRHWPTREALVLDAASRISAELEVPDTGSLGGDLTALLADTGHLLSTARWSSVVPSIVDVAERDPEFAGVHAKIQRGHAIALRKVLERAAGRGELSATADHSVMVSALIGPLYYRRWFSREPIDEQFVEAIVRNVISGEVQPGTRA